MWDMIAKEMGLPWRAVESMHWQMGCEDMASRANVPVFQPHVPPTTRPPSGSISMSGKRRSSRSPPVHSDSSVGGGPNSGSRGTPGATTRPRRSSSAASRRHYEVKSEAPYQGIPASHLPAVDEQHRGPRAGPGGPGERGSTDEREWMDREREESGYSRQSPMNSGSNTSGRSPPFSEEVGPERQLQRG